MMFSRSPRLGSATSLTSVPSRDRRAPRCRSAILVPLAGLSVLGWPLDTVGQDANLFAPPDSLEYWMRNDEFKILNCTDSRPIKGGDRTQQCTIAFTAGGFLRVKWAKAPYGGKAFNNKPHYEIAAYELQKLFLDPDDYVVPPTIARSVPFEVFEEMGRPPGVTFEGLKSNVVLMQYWLNAVTPDDVWDEDRFESDSLYARHIADLNILTYLIRHSDTNPGNMLLSTDPENPKVFSVDNGVSFGDESDRGAEWRGIRLDRLPGGTVERLRNITLEDVQAALGVLFQFEVEGDRLVLVEPTENLDPGEEVRKQGSVIQFGISSGDIEDVYERMQNLLEDVDKGELELF